MGRQIPIPDTKDRIWARVEKERRASKHLIKHLPPREQEKVIVKRALELDAAETRKVVESFGKEFGVLYDEQVAKRFAEIPELPSPYRYQVLHDIDAIRNMPPKPKNTLMKRYLAALRQFDGDFESGLENKGRPEGAAATRFWSPGLNRRLAYAMMGTFERRYGELARDVEQDEGLDQDIYMFSPWLGRGKAQELFMRFGVRSLDERSQWIEIVCEAFGADDKYPSNVLSDVRFGWQNNLFYGAKEGKYLAREAARQERSAKFLEQITVAAAAKGPVVHESKEVARVATALRDHLAQEGRAYALSNSKIIGFPRYAQILPVIEFYAHKFLGETLKVRV